MDTIYSYYSEYAKRSIDKCITSTYRKKKTKKKDVVDAIVANLLDSEKAIAISSKSKSKKKSKGQHLSVKVLKDVDILDYKIGEPISVKEAYANFFNIVIDLKKVPKEQSSLIISGPKGPEGFYDPIEMETIPFEKVLQLKECGTIISKDTAKQLIERGTTIWQGKESVGFKSPVTQTIYGNLVLYNYDNDEFFPQQNGVLMIRKDHHKVQPKKSQDVTEFYVMSYLNTRGTPYSFRSSGYGAVMYYPVNEEGTHMMKLMVDCFKKGNLFGFDRHGYVRHGRIHKKTELRGTFGYPDETYDIRETGELSGMGSTPYIASFGGSGVDPYPKEKRWTIVANY